MQLLLLLVVFLSAVPLLPQLVDLLVLVGEGLLQAGEGALGRVRLGLNSVQLGAGQFDLVLLLLEKFVQVLNLDGRKRALCSS